MAAGLSRQQHRVDNVNYAVIGFDIWGNNGGVVHLDTVRGINLDIRTFDGGRLIKLDDIRRQDFARNYMIGQDFRQLRNILQQRIYSSGRQLSKSLIGGCKNGERARALQSVYKTSSLNSSHEGIERTSANGGIYDVCHVCYLLCTYDVN